MLSRWIYEYEKEGINAFSGNGKKIQNKDYEIEELKQDNEILKKYHAFLKEKNNKI